MAADTAAVSWYPRRTVEGLLLGTDPDLFLQLAFVDLLSFLNDNSESCFIDLTLKSRCWQKSQKTFEYNLLLPARFADQHLPIEQNHIS